MVDRFIPKRINSDAAYFNLNNGSINSLTDISFKEENNYDKPTFLNTAQKATRILMYRNKMSKVFGLNQDKVLRSSKFKEKEKNKVVIKTASWPVKPRKKPLINGPLMILDMPQVNGIDSELYHGILDWGKINKIATIYNGEVHLWSFQDGVQTHTVTNNIVSHCIKWNKTGSHFAVSTNNSQVIIIDAKTLKITQRICCLSDCKACTITVIEWSKSGHVFIGCSAGALNIFNTKTKENRYYPNLFAGEITDMKLSCKDSFLLVTARRVTRIVEWRHTDITNIMKFSKIKIHVYVKSTAWHPWKNSILAVGESNNVVGIWNINTKQVIDYNIVEPYFKAASTCFLDFLTFCPSSAELVISFYYENPDSSYENGFNFLTVFSDLHTRVDEIRYHVGRVPLVIWNGTGTQFATLGTDENLVIWDFFGTDPTIKGKKISTKKPKKMTIFDVYPHFGPSIR